MAVVEAHEAHQNLVDELLDEVAGDGFDSLSFISRAFLTWL